MYIFLGDDSVNLRWVTLIGSYETINKTWPQLVFNSGTRSQFTNTVLYAGSLYGSITFSVRIIYPILFFTRRTGMRNESSSHRSEIVDVVVRFVASKKSMIKRHPTLDSVVGRRADSKNNNGRFRSKL